MNRTRFARGSGCYQCVNCGKQTRDTGDNGSCGLCPLCYTRCTFGNSLADSGKCPESVDPHAAFDDCDSESACQARLNQLIGGAP